VQVPGIVASPLADEVTHRVGALVVDHGLGRVVHLQAALNDNRLHKSLVHGHVWRDLLKDLAEGN
jgi:hypothetical protein